MHRIGGGSGGVGYHRGDPWRRGTSRCVVFFFVYTSNYNLSIDLLLHRSPAFFEFHSIPVGKMINFDHQNKFQKICRVMGYFYLGL
jgi:hypothetical protein